MRAWSRGLVGLFATACALPARDNPWDPAKAPVVTLSVLGSDGHEALEATRLESLSIRIEVHDPGGELVDVELTLVDPREQGSGTCPLFAPIPLASRQDISLLAELAWTAFPPPCFDPGTPSSRPQALRLHAEARNHAGFRSRTDRDVLLRNLPPTADGGPALWIDPRHEYFRPRDIALHTGTSADPEGDALTAYWNQRSGPPVTFTPPNGIATESEPVIAHFGTTMGPSFELELSVCDRWNDCASGGLLEVHLRPALWVITSEGIAQLDPEVGDARSGLEASDLVLAPALLPPSGFDAAHVAPARDGVWLVADADDPSPAEDERRFVYRVNGRFGVSRLPLPGSLLACHILGADASLDVAWVRTAETACSTFDPTSSIVRVGPGMLVSAPIPDPGVLFGLADLAKASQVVAIDTTPSPDLPEWIATLDPDFRSRIFRYDGLDLTEVVVGQGGDCVTSVGSQLAELRLTPDTDGSVWVTNRYGGLQHVYADGTVDPVCLSGALPYVIGSIRIPGDPEPEIWLSSDTGENVRVPLVTQENGARTFAPPVSGPSGWVPVAYEPRRDRVVGFDANDGTYLVFARGDYAGAARALLDPAGAGLELIDGEARMWAADTVRHRLVMRPLEKDLVRARFAGVGPDANTAELATVDPLSGRLWTVAGPELRAYDERGVAASLAVGGLSNAASLWFDGGTCRILAAPPCRSAAIWVVESAGTRIRRITLDGAEKSFEQLPGAPVQVALSPLGGRLWASFDGEGDVTVLELDTSGGAVIGTFAGEAADHPVAVGLGGNYWSISDAPSPAPNVIRTYSTTGVTEAHPRCIATPGAYPIGLATGLGSLVITCRGTCAGKGCVPPSWIERTPLDESTPFHALVSSTALAASPVTADPRGLHDVATGFTWLANGDVLQQLAPALEPSLPAPVFVDAKARRVVSH